MINPEQILFSVVKKTDSIPSKIRNKIKSVHSLHYDSILFLIYFNWRLITLQYCSVFCHTLIWISHGGTCVPHSEPCSYLPLPHPIPQGHPSATGPEYPVSCIEPGLAIYFTYSNIHVSMLFSQIILPLPSPTESKSLFITSVSLLLSRI